MKTFAGCLKSHFRDFCQTLQISASLKTGALLDDEACLSLRNSCWQEWSWKNLLRAVAQEFIPTWCNYSQNASLEYKRTKTPSKTAKLSSFGKRIVLLRKIPKFWDIQFDSTVYVATNLTGKKKNKNGKMSNFCPMKKGINDHFNQSI